DFYHAGEGVPAESGIQGEWWRLPESAEHIGSQRSHDGIALIRAEVSFRPHIAGVWSPYIPIKGELHGHGCCVWGVKAFQTQLHLSGPCFPFTLRFLEWLITSVGKYKCNRRVSVHIVPPTSKHIR